MCTIFFVSKKVQVLANIIQVLARGGICQIFYISKIPFFSILPEKNATTCQILEMKGVFHIYFEQIVSFCAIIYSNKKSLQLFCKNSSLNSANFTDRVVFRGNSWKMYPNPILSLVTFVTNSTSGFSIFCKLGPKLWIPIKCSLGTHFEGKFVYLSFISQISKSPFLVNQDILCAGSKILLLKFDSVCTCLSARFIWGQESFSSRSDVFRQLHFHAQIYWKWYKLYSMFTIIIGG